MTIEELAKLKANSVPNSNLVKYYEILWSIILFGGLLWLRV